LDSTDDDDYLVVMSSEKPVQNSKGTNELMSKTLTVKFYDVSTVYSVTWQGFNLQWTDHRLTGD